jgi:DNA-binding XRE family transcriptional regulator
MPTETLERRALERGERVAVARRRAGFSQEALAEQIGVGRQTIARLELGTQTPSVDTALAIAKAVDEPVEVLFGGGER